MVRSSRRPSGVLADRDPNDVTFEELAASRRRVAGARLQLLRRQGRSGGGGVRPLPAPAARRARARHRPLPRPIAVRLRAGIECYLRFAQHNVGSWRLMRDLSTTEHPDVRQARRERFDELAAGWGARGRGPDRGPRRGRPSSRGRPWCGSTAAATTSTAWSRCSSPSCGTACRPCDRDQARPAGRVEHPPAVPGGHAAVGAEPLAQLVELLAGRRLGQLVGHARSRCARRSRRSATRRGAAA